MKQYISINDPINWVTPVYAFDKLDGSNIRAEWSAKRCMFYKFGSRTKLIDRNEPIVGESIDLINERFTEKLSTKFLQKKWDSVICFFEFYGKSSFAGKHIDEKHEVSLIDIAPYRRGIIPPDQFVELCDDLDAPKVLYNGLINDHVIGMIRDGILPGMTFEGVVCKYSTHEGKQTKMFKIKSNAWLQRLKERCGSDEELFKRLA